jgi:ABC-type multidrug transport system fused ATPase/permease subunit
VSIVSSAVRRMQDGRTMLVIAHRPELVQHADRIVRLTDGAALPEPVWRAA